MISVIFPGRPIMSHPSRGHQPSSWPWAWTTGCAATRLEEPHHREMPSVIGTCFGTHLWSIEMSKCTGLQCESTLFVVSWPHKGDRRFKMRRRIGEGMGEIVRYCIQNDFIQIAIEQGKNAGFERHQVTVNSSILVKIIDLLIGRILRVVAGISQISGP